MDLKAAINYVNGDRGGLSPVGVTVLAQTGAMMQEAAATLPQSELAQAVDNIAQRITAEAVSTGGQVATEVFQAIPVAGAVFGVVQDIFAGLQEEQGVRDATLAADVQECWKQFNPVIPTNPTSLDVIKQASDFFPLERGGDAWFQKMGYSPAGWKTLGDHSYWPSFGELMVALEHPQDAANAIANAQPETWTGPPGGSFVYGIPAGLRDALRALRVSMGQQVGKAEGGNGLWNLYMDLLYREFARGHLTEKYVQLVWWCWWANVMWGVADKNLVAAMAWNNLPPMLSDYGIEPWQCPFFDRRAPTMLMTLMRRWAQLVQGPKASQFAKLSKDALAKLNIGRIVRGLGALPSKANWTSIRAAARAARGQ